MKTKQIPRAEWTSFFDGFSRRQEGWQVTLEIMGPEIGDQVEQREMFLSGLTAEVSAGGATEDDKIEIMVGGNRRSHVTHVIKAPTEVDLQQTDLGVDRAVQIRSADGTTAILHLA
jgi:hypothetical protein